MPIQGQERTHYEHLLTDLDKKSIAEFDEDHEDLYSKTKDKLKAKAIKIAVGKIHKQLQFHSENMQDLVQF